MLKYAQKQIGLRFVTGFVTGFVTEFVTEFVTGMK